MGGTSLPPSQLTQFRADERGGRLGFALRQGQRVHHDRPVLQQGAGQADRDDHAARPPSTSSTALMGKAKAAGLTGHGGGQQGGRRRVPLPADAELLDGRQTGLGVGVQRSRRHASTPPRASRRDRRSTTGTRPATCPRRERARRRPPRTRSSPRARGCSSRGATGRHQPGQDHAQAMSGSCRCRRRRPVGQLAAMSDAATAFGIAAKSHEQGCCGSCS